MLIKLEYFQRISEKKVDINLIKIRPMGAELFHADGQTNRQTDGRTDGHDEANSHFSKVFECS